MVQPRIYKGHIVPSFVSMAERQPGGDFSARQSNLTNVFKTAKLYWLCQIASNCLADGNSIRSTGLPDHDKEETSRNWSAAPVSLFACLYRGVCSIFILKIFPIFQIHFRVI